MIQTQSSTILNTKYGGIVKQSFNRIISYQITILMSKYIADFINYFSMVAEASRPDNAEQQEPPKVNKNNFLLLWTRLLICSVQKLIVNYHYHILNFFQIFKK